MLVEAAELIKNILEIIGKGLEIGGRNLSKDQPKNVRDACNQVFFALSDLEESSNKFLAQLEEVVGSQHIEPWHIYQLYGYQKEMEQALKALSKARKSAFRTLDIYEPQTYAWISGVEQMKTAVLQEIDGFMACAPRVGLVKHSQDIIIITEPSEPPNIKYLEKRYPVGSQQDLDNELTKDLYYLQKITPSNEVRFQGMDNDRSYLDAGYKNVLEIVRAKESLRNVLLARYPKLKD